MRLTHLLFAATVPMLLLCPAARAQDETQPPVETQPATAPPPDAETVTLPDNEKESCKTDAFASVLSFLGVPKPGEHLRPGATYTTYVPNSNAIRDLFGNQWTFLLPGFGRLDVPQSHAVLAPEINLVTSSRSGNRATLVPLGATYTTGFGDARTRGTLGIGTGLLLLESRVTSRNMPSRWRGGVNGSAFAGVAFGGSGSLQIGYRWADKIRGFDLSGTSLEASFRF